MHSDWILLLLAFVAGCAVNFVIATR